jgi:hypothetical protein
MHSSYAIGNKYKTILLSKRIKFLLVNMVKILRKIIENKKQLILRFGLMQLSHPSLKLRLLKDTVAMGDNDSLTHWHYGAWRTLASLMGDSNTTNGSRDTVWERP